MKLSEAITGPGHVAVRQSDGAVAFWVMRESVVLIRPLGQVDWYKRADLIHGDDWVRVWPETERIVQLREHVWRNAKLVSDCLEQVPGGLTNSMPIEKVPVEIANRIQELKARIAELERGEKFARSLNESLNDRIKEQSDRIHELENPVLGPPLPAEYVIPLPAEYVIPAGTPWLFERGGQVRPKVSNFVVKVSRDGGRRWLDPRPMPKLPEPEPEPDKEEQPNKENELNAYELPLGTTLVIGKRRWKLVDRQEYHPDYMTWDETTGDEPDKLTRIMYPSEVQWLIEHGAKVLPPEPEPRYTVAMVDSSTPWVVRENGVTIGWHYTKADAERIARLLNERKGE